jgi:hypothetical protein
MSTPIQLIFVVAIAAALAIECESLKCYVYDTGMEPMETPCSDAKYCVKQMGSGVLIGGCDELNGTFCSSNGCHDKGNLKECCCDTDLCNTDNFVTACAHL